MSYKEEIRTWFRQGLIARIDALNSAKAALQQQELQAGESIRRIAHSLRGSGQTYGFPEITRMAGEVEEATDTGLLTSLDRLLAAMREVASGADGAKIKILVIEDDLDTAALVQTALASDNREIVLVGSAAEAERVLNDDDIRMVILDLVLPDTDGRNLLVKLREQPRTAAIPVIVVSVLVGPLPKTECFALGADEYFEKPIDAETFAVAVSAKLQRATELNWAARRDPLTGLRNRAGFTEAFNHELSRSDRTQSPLAIAILDLDHFREINDLHGHAAGDHALQAFSKTLSRTVRRADLVARWGGDEYVVLFPNTGVPGAVLALKKVQRAARAPWLVTGAGVEIRASFSSGVARVSGTPTVDEAVAAADRMLYLAKASGRNRIVSSPEEVMRSAERILLVEDDEFTARIIEQQLEIEGFEVVRFGDGLAAYEAAPDLEVSLAILDIKLPGLDGFELLTRLQQIPAFARVPILILTSMGREQDVVKGFELGASDYMTKPFSAAELFARMHRLLRSRERVVRL